MKMVNGGVLKRILKYTKPYIIYLILALVMAIINVSTTLYTPILIGVGVDRILGKGNVDFQGLLPILTGLGALIVTTAVSQWLMGLCTNKVSFHTAEDIRTDAFKRLQTVPLKFIDSNRHGDILSRVITDVEQISDGLLMGFTQLFARVITILGTIGFMLTIDFKITAIVVVLTPLSLFVASFIARRTYNMFKLQSETRGELTSLVEEMISNQKVVKAFGYEKESQKSLRRSIPVFRNMGLKLRFSLPLQILLRDL